MFHCTGPFVSEDREAAVSTVLLLALTSFVAVYATLVSISSMCFDQSANMPYCNRFHYTGPLG